MVVETVTTFGVDDLAFVKIRCTRCQTALELAASCKGAVEQFRQRVTSRAGVQCSQCGSEAPTLLRLESEYQNETHGPVNGTLALLVLTLLQAAVAGGTPEEVQVRFAVGRAVRKESSPAGGSS